MISKEHSAMAAMHLAGLVKSCYGNPSSVRCVVGDGKESVLVKDALVLLQLLDIEHPVAQLIVSMCQGHRLCHGSGVKSLLVMTGSLTEAYMTLKDQGIPEPMIFPTMRSVLSECMEKLSDIQISVTTLPDQQSAQSNYPTLEEHTENSFQLPVGHTSCIEEDSVPHFHSEFNGIKSVPSVAYVNDPSETECSKTLRHNMDPLAKTNAPIMPITSLERSTKKMFTDQASKDMGVSGPHQVEVEETRFVHLEMKPQVKDNDEDNIDWFFETTTQDMELNISHKTPPERKDPVLHGKKKTGKIFSSLSDNCQNDSDFEDCFDEDPSTCSSSCVETGNVNVLEACGEHQNKACGNSDNEFDSCFDDLNNIPENVKSSDKCLSDIERINLMLERVNKKKNEQRSDFKGESENDKTLHKHEVSNKVILNCSRHFKTVDSTIEQMQVMSQTNTNFLKKKTERESTEQKDAMFLIPKFESSENDFKSDCDSLTPRGDMERTIHSETVPENTFNKKSKLNFESNLQKILAAKTRESHLSSLSQSRHFKSDKSDLKSNIPHLDSLCFKGNEKTDSVSSKCNPASTVQSFNEDVSICRTGIESKFDKHVLIIHKDSLPALERGCVGLLEVAQGLSRGCKETMDLVLQAVQTKIGAKEKQELNEKLLQTFTVFGPSSHHSTVIPGLMLQCQKELVSKFTIDKTWNVLLLNGDLSAQNHHLGYKTSTDGRVVIGSASISKSDSTSQWMYQCKDIIIKLNVDLVLVRGETDAAVYDRLEAEGVCVISGVPHSLLLAVREMTGTEIAVYVTDMNKSHVCHSLEVKPFTSSWCDKINKGNYSLLVMNKVAVSTPFWQTIVLCHPNEAALDVREQEAIACIRRLAAALHDGMVLPGGGETERICSQFLLEKLGERQNKYRDPDHSLIVTMETMVDMFNKIVTLVETNSVYHHHQDHHPSHQDDSLCLSQNCREERIFDNYKAKKAVWTSALDIVAIATQTDTFITTGLSTGSGALHNGIIL